MEAHTEKMSNFAVRIFHWTTKLEEVIDFRSSVRNRFEPDKDDIFERQYKSLHGNIGSAFAIGTPQINLRFNNFSEEDCSMVAHALAIEEVDKTVGIVDAAAIVFAHSIFEEIFYGLLEIAFEADPASWDQELAGRKVEFDQAMSLSPDELRKIVWKRSAKQNSQESLTKHVKAFVGRCRRINRSSHDECMGRYGIDLNQLQPIDTLRHELVHEPRRSKSIAEASTYLDFLCDTARLLIEITANCLLEMDVRVANLSVIHGHNSPYLESPQPPLFEEQPRGDDLSM